MTSRWDTENWPPSSSLSNCCWKAFCNNTVNKFQFANSLFWVLYQAHFRNYNYFFLGFIRLFQYTTLNNLARQAQYDAHMIYNKTVLISSEETFSTIELLSDYIKSIQASVELYQLKQILNATGVIYYDIVIPCRTESVTLNRLINVTRRTKRLPAI